MIEQQIVRDPIPCADTQHILALNALTLTWFCKRCLIDMTTDEVMPR